MVQGKQLPLHMACKSCGAGSRAGTSCSFYPKTCIALIRYQCNAQLISAVTHSNGCGPHILHLLIHPAPCDITRPPQYCQLNWLYVHPPHVGPMQTCTITWYAQGYSHMTVPNILGSQKGLLFEPVEAALPASPTGGTMWHAVKGKLKFI